MKKTLLIVAVLSITVLALGLAGYAYAQDQTPERPYSSGMMTEGYDRGMMGGHGMMDEGYGRFGGEGPIHDAMVTAAAQALGLAQEEIEARHDAGETLWEIAESEGLSAEEIQDLMFSAHDLALENAIANGWLTEEQAEWMDAHMEQMWDGGSHCGSEDGAGIGPHRGGMNW